MQFLTLYTAAAPAGGPPFAEHMARMSKLMEELFKAGVLKASGGTMSRETGMKVSLKNGGFTVTDGPVAGIQADAGVQFHPAGNQFAGSAGGAHQGLPQSRR